MSVHYVGTGSTDTAGRVVIYCNGINNTKADAKKTGADISQLFGQKVGVFHNPTGLFNRDDENIQGHLATQLLKELQTITATGKRVVLLAHSHGAAVCFNALHRAVFFSDSEATAQHLADRVHLYTFGGAIMVSGATTNPHNSDPCLLASKVHNYVCEQDAVSCTAADSYGLLSKALLQTKDLREEREKEHLFVDLSDAAIAMGATKPVQDYLNQRTILLFQGKKFKDPKLPELKEGDSGWKKAGKIAQGALTLALHGAAHGIGNHMMLPSYLLALAKVAKEEAPAAPAAAAVVPADAAAVDQ